MKDNLLDLVSHTFTLGNVNTIKVQGGKTETKVDAIAEDRTVIIQGTFKKPIPEFEGTFGMPNLSKLNIILGIPEYKDNPKISISTQDKNGETVKTGISFENAAGDFKNDYRFMSKEIVEEQLKTVKFRGVNWNVDFSPNEASIQRFKFQTQANAEHPSFIAKTEGSDLKFFFGEATSHAGNFVFAADVEGKLTKPWSWPVAPITAILGLTGDKTIKFSDEGAAMLTVDSGIAEYNYIIPALTK